MRHADSSAVDFGSLAMDARDYFLRSVAMLVGLLAAAMPVAAEPVIAPAIESEPPPATPTRPGRKPVPPPPQRYVPAEPKQNVFKKKKK